MSEKMLVTQALDERDLLVKKINEKIKKASFVDAKKRNEEKVMNSLIPEAEFKKSAESAYQQIRDLIDRFNRIEAAIVASNAATVVHTSFGDYTVAAAIALRNRMKVSFSKETAFEDTLYKKIEDQVELIIMQIDEKNRHLEATAENMRESILGKDSKTKDNKPLEVVEAFVNENKTEIVDPLDIRNKLDEIKEKRNKQLSELDTQIKVSNATTLIEI